MNPTPTNLNWYLGLWDTYMPFFEKVYLPIYHYLSHLTGNLSDKVGG